MKKFHESLENNIKILRGDIIKQESFEKYVNSQPKEKQEKIVSDFKKLGFSFKGFLKKFATI